MSKALFDQIAAALQADGPNLVKAGGAIFQFVISDTDTKFCLDLKNSNGSASFEENLAADVNHRGC